MTTPAERAARLRALAHRHDAEADAMRDRPTAHPDVIAQYRDEARNLRRRADAIDTTRRTP